ncbi:sensor histidine kinase [Pseudoalteromonas mariniglutinosa]|uniref:sensor histidine kinase n=1 Tax=Pseudoalteromonas mariniglutinosa TaxID=206042 RepID=UPI00384CE9F7
MSKQAYADDLLIAALFKERGVLALLVVAQVLATLLAFAPNSYGDIWQRLATISLFLHLIFLSSVSFLYLINKPLAGTSERNQLLIMMLTLLVTTVIYSGLFITIPSLFDAVDEPFEFVLKNLLMILLVAALFIQFLLLHHEKELQTKALASAELDALQARIRPHFLFNSLNTAAELTHIDAKAAEQAILALAALSQAAMKSGKAILLSDEINLSKQYVALEKWRYGERLKIDWQLPDDLPVMTVPCLTLQPLIENAVCHGVEPNLAVTTVNVELFVSNKTVTVLVTNPITANTQTQRFGNGMALANINRRLALFYQAKAGLTVIEKEGIFRVKLVLPREMSAELT